MFFAFESFNSCHYAAVACNDYGDGKGGGGGFSAPDLVTYAHAGPVCLVTAPGLDKVGVWEVQVESVRVTHELERRTVSKW